MYERQSSAKHSPSGTQRFPRRMYPESHAQEATPLDSWHALLEGHWREAQESTAARKQERCDGIGWDGIGWDVHRLAACKLRHIRALESKWSMERRQRVLLTDEWK